MKRVIVALSLLATPAIAQQPPSPPGQKAWEIMFNREVAVHQNDLGAALQMQDQITDLTKQVTALTKERDALKVPAAPDAGK